jgi:hypothetical protein
MTITQNGHDVFVDPTNDAANLIDLAAPYVATVTIEGTAPMLMHRYSVEAVEAKGKAAKNSAAKKADDVDSYVYRDRDGMVCVPGAYIIGSLIDPRNGAAKYRQDPRSPRKSALDLFRAGVVALGDLNPLLVDRNGKHTPTDTWDYLDRRRVNVQRQAIARTRPAWFAGWRVQTQVQVLTPEYIDRALLLDVLTQAGRLVGIGDFRPTFGRFAVVGFDIEQP